MSGEVPILIALVAGLGGWVISRFTRRPDALARVHDAGAHAWMFTSTYARAGALALVGARGARVDVYAEALVITGLAPRVVVRRASIRSIAREDAGLAATIRGPITRITTTEHADVVLATTPAIHHRLRKWFEPDYDAGEAYES